MEESTTSIITKNILDDFFNSKLAFYVLDKKDIPALLNIINKRNGNKVLMDYERFGNGLVFTDGQLCHAPIEFYRKRGFSITRVFRPVYSERNEEDSIMSVSENFIIAGGSDFSIIQRELLEKDNFIFYSKNHAFRTVKDDESEDRFLELWEQNNDGCLGKTDTRIHEKEIDNIIYCLELCKNNLNK